MLKTPEPVFFTFIKAWRRRYPVSLNGIFSIKQRAHMPTTFQVSDGAVTQLQNC